jgi:hypothetical protein
MKKEKERDVVEEKIVKGEEERIKRKKDLNTI